MKSDSFTWCLGSRYQASCCCQLLLQFTVDSLLLPEERRVSTDFLLWKLSIVLKQLYFWIITSHLNVSLIYRHNATFDNSCRSEARSFERLTIMLMMQIVTVLPALGAGRMLSKVMVNSMSPNIINYWVLSHWSLRWCHRTDTSLDRKNLTCVVGCD